MAPGGMPGMPGGMAMAAGGGTAAAPFLSSPLANLSVLATAQSPVQLLTLQIWASPSFLIQRLLPSASPARSVYFVPPVSKTIVALGGARPISSGFLPSPKSAAESVLNARTKFSTLLLSSSAMGAPSPPFVLENLPFQSSPDFSKTNEPFSLSMVAFLTSFSSNLRMSLSRKPLESLLKE